jgi:hypothetical protein
VVVWRVPGFPARYIIRGFLHSALRRFFTHDTDFIVHRILPTFKIEIQVCKLYPQTPNFLSDSVFFKMLTRLADMCLYNVHVIHMDLQRLNYVVISTTWLHGAKNNGLAVTSDCRTT